jgi:hypothetical protein
MTNICDRWAQSKTDNLQTAWFNGQGFESWENVWGTWNGITPRDGEAIRRVATMLRFFGSDAAGKPLRSPRWIPTPRFPYYYHIWKCNPRFCSLRWIPHTTSVVQDNHYASEWPAEATPGLTVWSLVNRAGVDTHGEQLQVAPFDVLDIETSAFFSAKISKNAEILRWKSYDGIVQVVPQSAASRFYDCYHGVPLTPGPYTPPPSPAVRKGYTGFPGANSYPGHGGNAIDTNPLTNLTLDACLAKVPLLPYMDV